MRISAAHGSMVVFKEFGASVPQLLSLLESVWRQRNGATCRLWRVLLVLLLSVKQQEALLQGV